MGNKADKSRLFVDFMINLFNKKVSKDFREGTCKNLENTGLVYQNPSLTKLNRRY